MLTSATTKDLFLTHLAKVEMSACNNELSSSLLSSVSSSFSVGSSTSYSLEPEIFIFYGKINHSYPYNKDIYIYIYISAITLALAEHGKIHVYRYEYFNNGNLTT